MPSVSAPSRLLLALSLTLDAIVNANADANTAAGPDFHRAQAVPQYPETHDSTLSKIYVLSATDAFPIFRDPAGRLEPVEMATPETLVYGLGTSGAKMIEGFESWQETEKEELGYRAVEPERVVELDPDPDPEDPEPEPEPGEAQSGTAWSQYAGLSTSYRIPAAITFVIAAFT